MRTTGRALFALFGLFAVIVFAIAVSPLIWPFAVLPHGRRQRYAMFGARVFGWLCVRALLWGRITIVGKENLPEKPGFLIISNHRSWADVGMLICYTASQGISKKEVAYVPFFGLNGYLSGAVFFDRNNRAARAKVISDALFLMRNGTNLHVFPEGTRTRDGRISEKVFLRLVQEACKAGIEVVPVCVWDTEKAVPVGGFAASPLQSFGMEIGRPVSREGFEDEEQYARAAWQRVLELARARGADEPFRTPR